MPRGGEQVEAARRAVAQLAVGRVPAEGELDGREEEGEVDAKRGAAQVGDGQLGLIDGERRDGREQEGAADDHAGEGTEPVKGGRRWRVVLVRLA